VLSVGPGLTSSTGRPADAATHAIGPPADSVSATVETQPVPNAGDAADDAAIWINPQDPSLSTIIATDKQGGLLVYDLFGRQLQSLPLGKANNVDLRGNLVTISNRSNNSIDIHEMDPATRQVRAVAAGGIQPGLEVYGSCLYRSARTGTLHVFVTSKQGEVEQWQLSGDGFGRVGGTLVRAWRVGSQTEGCVADDELGHLYVGEETRGIWKLGAESDAPAPGALIAETSPSGPLVGEVEGLTIARGAAGGGYLIAASQKNDSFVVYARDGDNAFVGTFSIVPGNGIDGAEETDGIDVTTAHLGPAFPSGVFVAQDGNNDNGAQNFKLVPYERVFPG
jgi:3-phytase